MLKSNVNSKNTLIKYLDKNKVKSFATIVTFGDICNMMENKESYNLHVPIFQTDLNHDKVNEMVESFRKCPSHFLSQLLLTVACVTLFNDEKNYIMDGQHRIEMIKILHEKDKINREVILVTHMIDNECSFKELFNVLNKDSAKNAVYISMDFFKRQIVDQIKKELEKKMLKNSICKNIKVISFIL